MFKFINGILDKLIFTASFILGIQLPAFIQAYQQHLSGRLSEAKIQLAHFQAIADQQFNGNLQHLINSFANNNEQAINKTATAISQLVERFNTYQHTLDELQTNDYATRIYSFVKTLDLTIAKNTAQNFVPTIPLEVQALATGLIVSLILLLITEGVRLFFINLLGLNRAANKAFN